MYPCKEPSLFVISSAQKENLVYLLLLFNQVNALHIYRYHSEHVNINLTFNCARSSLSSKNVGNDRYIQHLHL